MARHGASSGISSHSRRFSTAVNPINISLLSKQVIQLGRINNPDTFPEITHQKELQASSLTSKLDDCTGLHQIKQVHAHVIRQGHDQSCYIITKLIRTLTRLGVPMDPYPRRVMELVQFRNPFLWTAVIRGYAVQGNLSEAVSMYGCMRKEGITPVSFTFSALLKACGSVGDLSLGRQFHAQTFRLIAVAGFISACAQLGASKYADRAVEIALKSGYSPSGHVVIGSALIDMYSKCGDVEEAVNVFESMNNKNVFSYSSMILGLAMHGRAREALDLFHYMVKQTTIKPNTVTFVGVLTACSHAGLVDQGRQIFASMHQTFGVEPTCDLYTCMVDLLGRAGRLQEALEVIKTMSVEPHGGVWGALLGACRIHKDPDVAEIAAKHLFEIEPDVIGNYILLCNVYASAGDWEGVLSVRKLIKEKGLKKTPAVSWVVDENGQTHKFFPGNMNHPMSDKIQETLEELVQRLTVLGYEPDLSSVPYNASDDEKRSILICHTEKLALAFSLLTTSRDCEIKIMKNLRMCQDCHTFMRLASEVTGRVIIMRDNMRFHHFRNGACSCGDFW
ncbi:hypothetical protein DY000_02013351 [Brassica cretica]|uniref:DYW domain-containing protein n=1 Tax=Brassica cretica TaxID=69181 RepID=A0ABQ7D376_BRACR|nr:hypothetical protein DY000_02013351 [Brassica cretica]